MLSGQVGGERVLPRRYTSLFEGARGRMLGERAGPALTARSETGGCVFCAWSRLSTACCILWTHISHRDTHHLGGEICAVREWGGATRRRVAVASRSRAESWWGFPRKLSSSTFFPSVAQIEYLTVMTFASTALAAVVHPPRSQVDLLARRPRYCCVSHLWKPRAGPSWPAGITLSSGQHQPPASSTSFSSQSSGDFTRKCQHLASSRDRRRQKLIWFDYVNMRQCSII